LADITISTEANMASWLLTTKFKIAVSNNVASTKTFGNAGAKSKVMVMDVSRSGSRSASRAAEPKRKE